MRFAVDGWDPGYGSSDDVAPAPADSDQQLDAGVEVAEAAWAPVAVPGQVALPSQLLVVDGVRRIDARLTVGDGPGTVPGIAFSWAAAVVACRPGHEARVCDPLVSRGLFSASTELEPLRLPAPAGVLYERHQVSAAPDGDPLVPALQAQLGHTEARVAQAARLTLGADDDLLLLDGPVRRSSEQLPRCLGYVKSHARRYLPPALEAVVKALGPGERTPVFVLTATRALPRATWYLRLPGATGGGLDVWGGVVRLEVTLAAGDVGEAVRLASVTQLLLPPLAISPHKDARAPQQLVPVAGLERMLRQRLGDRRLLLRGIRAASAA